ncbi:MAG: NAD(P)-dependent alcohol dehydrogenase [Fibrobacter sp.]|nr:NAD(P)-dependent alcohol dehydrogenase [Fibrobacter sp.]
MRAIICEKYGSPEVLKLAQIEKPFPQKNEILIKIYSTAVTSSDTYIRRLNILPLFYRIMAGLFVGFGKPRNPILGMIVSGVIVETGKGVTRFKKGDEVFGTTVLNGIHTNLGTYADYKCLPEKSYITLKPNNMNFIESAAIVFGGSIAIWCFDKTGFPYDYNKSAKGIKVLVYGASGSVGTSLVQIASYFGAEVTAVCSSSNFELLKSLGASKFIDYKTDDFTLTGETWDYIFDAVGYKKSKEYVKNYKRALSSVGKFHSVDDGSPKNSEKQMMILKNITESGALTPVIDKIYSLDQIVMAHQYVDQGHKKGNVIINL